MSDTVTATTKAVHRRVLVPWLVVVLGATMIVGAAVYGFISIGSTGTGHLDTVPLGQQLTFKPSGSYRANIFTPRESLSTPATVCRVSTADGRPVTLRDATPYTINRRYSMESSYGFHLEAQATYLITCGNLGEPGMFAVVEISPNPRRNAIVIGVTGLVTLLGGVGTLLIRRRHPSNV